MTESVADSLPSKDSNLEKNTDLVARTVMKKVEIGVGLIDSTAPDLRDSDKDVLLLKLADEKEMGPVPPMIKGENLELSSSFDEIEGEDLALGRLTPTGSIFDPFAPGPEELAFAPMKKMMKETRISLRKQLNFEPYYVSMGDIEMDVWEEGAEEERFLDSVCKSFLDLIISNQLREVSADNIFMESNLSHTFKTPTSLPFITGIAETCPSTPIKPSSKSRMLCKSICRKLEFGPNLL